MQLAVVDDLGWIFREQATEDFGIDAQIELVDDDETVAGRLIGVQIKSGSSYLRDVERSKTEAGWSYWGDADHYSYWVGHCLPVIIVFVDEHKNVYWQTTDGGDHLKETPGGFTAWVPDTNRLDAAAKAALESYARQWRDVTARLPDLLEGVPPECHKQLKRASDVDAGATGRLAELLHDGWVEPELTLSTLVDAPPTWVAGSPAAESLWFAVGSFGLSHDLDELAADAFLAAAAFRGEHRPRALAFAGLSLLNVDRKRAAPYLYQAADEGAELLAHVGITALDVPLDDARVLEIPACMRDASDDVLDAEPTVLNFLGEMALRSGDPDAAVAYRERAARQLHSGSAMDLALAQTLVRRGRLNSGTASDARRAVALLNGVVENRRRWHGPSSEALEALVDLHLVSGSNEDALLTALPKVRGGYALDHELTTALARSGAAAAIALGRDDDLSYFEQRLVGTVEGREIRTLRMESEAYSREARIEALNGLLDEATDDPMRARAVDRLARLGHWSPVADEMIARSVLPAQQADVLRATFEAADPDGDPAVGLMRLRDLARVTPLAAIQLVGLQESAGELDTAITDCTEFAARWPDETILGVDLVALTWANGEPGDAVELTRRYAADHRLPDPTRIAMCRASAARLYRDGRYDDAIEMDRLGLSVGDDAELIWNLIAALHATARITEALRELRNRNAVPATGAETRLWLELHLGVDLTAGEVRTLIDLAHAELDIQLRNVMHHLLDREVVNNTGQQGHLDAALVQEASDLLDRDAPDRHRGDTDETTGEAAERLRSMLSRRGITSAQVTSWLGQYTRGIHPLHQIAADLGQAYGFALVQRPAAVYAISDLTPGLREVGRTAARHALTAAGCVVDLSALLTLAVIPDSHQAPIRARLGNLWLPASSARDAYTAKEQVRDAAARTTLLAQHSDGTSSWVSPTLAERARSRDLAQQLVDLVDVTRTQSVAGVGITGQLLGLGEARSLPIWCDDNAMRQILRRTPGTETFSTVELLDELGLRDGDADTVLLALARANSVDLPLSGHHLAELITTAASEGDLTRNSASVIALSRAGWWDRKHRNPQVSRPAGATVEWGSDWRADWPPVAVAAANAGTGNFLLVFGAALTGVSDADTGAARSRNQLALFVHTLTACWNGGVRPPASLLENFDGSSQFDVGPDPINAALIARLSVLGDPDPTATAWDLLHP